MNVARAHGSSAERAAASVPEQVRAQIDAWASGWLKTFARGLDLRAADPGPFNYPIAVFLNSAARTSTSMPGSALAADASRMISSFVTRGDGGGQLAATG